jgi:hypothetical protein
MPTDLEELEAKNRAHIDKHYAEIERLKGEANGGEPSAEQPVDPVAGDTGDEDKPVDTLQEAIDFSQPLPPTQGYATTADAERTAAQARTDLKAMPVGGA